jgi:cell division protein FtsB
MRWMFYLSVPAVFMLILLYRIWFDDTGVIASWKLEQQIETLSADVETQQSRNDWLSAEVISLQNSDELIEEKAREDLGLIKENESFYLILDKE